ncbi:MAG TPA: HlyD family efflux transporter periplasmic adaptor subunit, partial [Longimicrobiaceae bacterium]|nr:HlyD family efflux transporter periplasmic adaptor subunit [Longimicrobiaceae bacterium]
EIRSEEIDDILSAMPGGLVRWGISGVFLTLCVLLGIGWFISYPDVVKGRIALTTPTPPVRLVARGGGEVARVFAGDGARVRAGDPLVLLKNPADYADVQALKGVLERMEPALAGAGPVPDPSFGRPLALGSLQPAFSALQQAYSDHRLASDDGFHAQKLAAARAQVADLERLRGQLQAQQGLVEEQLALAGRARERTRQMAAQSLVPATDVERAEEEYLQRRYAVENGRTAITNNEIQLASQRAALLDLEQRRSDEGQRGLVALRNAHHALRAAVSGWEQENLLRAPVDGTVSFFRELRANQFVASAEALVAVVPAGGGLVGQVSLSGTGAGKVEAGQRVIIRLDGYPYREYGTLEGRVERISLLGFQPDARTPEVTYQAEVSLPRGLVTSYDRSLEFRQEMRGEVDVVTEELRLLERVFNQFRSLRAAR